MRERALQQKCHHLQQQLKLIGEQHASEIDMQQATYEAAIRAKQHALDRALEAHGQEQQDKETPKEIRHRLERATRELEQERAQLEKEKKMLQEQRKTEEEALAKEKEALAKAKEVLVNAKAVLAKEKEALAKEKDLLAKAKEAFISEQ